MAEIKLDGLGVALITPFKKDLAIDFKSLDNILDLLLTGGADYIVVCGTTAETPTLSYEEKFVIANFVKEKIKGRIPLVIGIGGNSTASVVHDLKTLNLEGYSAVLSVTPYYNKPSQDGLFLHYKALSEVSALPLILYNVPGRTGVNLSADTTLRLAKECTNIIAIKEASGNLNQSEKIILNSPSGFKLISGDDAATSSLMQQGACGVISVMANAFPKEVKKLIDLSFRGEFDKSNSLQEKYKPLIEKLFEDGNPAGVKYILSRMGLIENVLRLPLTPVSKFVAEKLDKEVIEFTTRVK